MKCPRCEHQQLSPQIYEGVTIDRCGACNGVWLDASELTTIVETKEEKFSPKLISKTMKGARSGVGVNDERVTAKCPKCATPMLVVNYEYSSGIIIDSCPNDHGIWLDNKELEAIQAFKEEWDDTSKEKNVDWLLAALENDTEHTRRLTERIEKSSFLHRWVNFLGKTFR